MVTSKSPTFSLLLRAKLIRLFLRMLPFPMLPGPELFDIVNSIRRSQTDLGNRVEEAITSLRKSSELVSSLEKTLQERTEKLADLEQQYAHYSKLASAKADEAEAIIKQVEKTLKRGIGKERFIALGMNLLAGIVIFVAGTLFGDSIFGWIAGIWIKVFSH